MICIRRSWGWQLLVSALIVGGVATFGNCTLAQVVGDTTLGAESSLVTSPTPGRFLINGGATRGTNLFHSFSQFSIPANGFAFFNNALTIENIITRVTGTSVSNINGAIRSNGTANLFLINPNGIVFGAGAALNIGGSFVASTARGLVFDNGFEFSATNPQAPPLLMVSVPVGLQYGSNIGSIQAQRSLLRVRDGKTLALVGGNVQLDGARLFALGGRVELAGVGGTGRVGLSGNGNNLSLTLTDALPRSDVSLYNGADVNTRAGGGGTIIVNAHNLNMAGNSKVRTGIASGLGSVDSQAGNIEVNATGAINLSNFSFISNAVLDRAVGKSGNINITSESLFLSDDAFVTTSTFGQGDAGNVTVTVGDAVVVTTGAFLASNTLGHGNGGSVTLVAPGQISFDGASGVFSDVELGAIGNGGDINITAGSLFMSNGAALFAKTSGQGNAGNVTIQATGAISFDAGSDEGSSGVYNNVASTGVGKGGDIKITARSLSLTNGAELATSSLGQGYAGSMIIKVRDTVSFDGVGRNGDSSGLLSRLGVGAIGKGGDINITTGALSVSRGAELSASTFGQGDAGNVTITARDSVSFDGEDNSGFASGVFSRVAATAVGQGGDINITTNSLSVTNGAALTVSSSGQGDAGDIQITARDLVLNNQATIQAETLSGNGGNIILNVQDLLLMRRNSLISTTAGTAQQGGDGGNMNINAQFIVAVPKEDSDITADAFTGRGGNINITTQGIYGLQYRPQGTPLSDITASSRFGVNGTVQINTPDVDPSRGLANLPTEPVDASSQIAQTCSIAGKVAQNKFIVTGRGGLPDDPNQTLSTDAVWTDLRLPPQKTAISSNSSQAQQPTHSNAAPLVEAQGWVINDKGQVILTASAPTVIPQRPGLTPASCSSP